MVDQLVIYTVILRQITLEKRYSKVTSQLADIKLDENRRKTNIPSSHVQLLQGIVLGGDQVGAFGIVDLQRLLKDSSRERRNHYTLGARQKTTFSSVTKQL